MLQHPRRTLLQKDLSTLFTCTEQVFFLQLSLMVMSSFNLQTYPGQTRDLHSVSALLDLGCKHLDVVQSSSMNPNTRVMLAEKRSMKMMVLWVQPPPTSTRDLETENPNVDSV